MVGLRSFVASQLSPHIQCSTCTCISSPVDGMNLSSNMEKSGVGQTFNILSTPPAYMTLYMYVHYVVHANFQRCMPVHVHLVPRRRPSCSGIQESGVERGSVYSLSYYNGSDKPTSVELAHPAPL